MKMIVQKVESAQAVDLVRTDKELNLAVLGRQMELCLVKMPYLGKFVSHCFVRRHVIKMATLDHKRPGCY